MEKYKLFEGYITSIGDEINYWLKNNKVEITHVVQSAGKSYKHNTYETDVLLISIFYRDAKTS